MLLSLEAMRYARDDGVPGAWRFARGVIRSHVRLSVDLEAAPDRLP